MLKYFEENGKSLTKKHLISKKITHQNGPQLTRDHRLKTSNL